jgi:ribulose kinase
MTPKEKAEWLFDRMRDKIPDFLTVQMTEECTRKQCLLCCDQVLETMLKWSTSFEPYAYWQEVRNEIQKMLFP